MNLNRKNKIKFRKQR